MHFDSNNNLNWEKWKKILGTAINAGRNVGLSDEIIESSAKRIGDFLSITTQPDSESERLLLNLWKNATNEEKKVISRLLIKMVDDNKMQN